MPVEWERIPDRLPEDFRALDGDEIVGWARSRHTDSKEECVVKNGLKFRSGPRLSVSAMP